jgi:hypothetical protein
MLAPIADECIGAKRAIGGECGHGTGLIKKILKNS